MLKSFPIVMFTIELYCVHWHVSQSGAECNAAEAAILIASRTVVSRLHTWRKMHLSVSEQCAFLLICVTVLQRLLALINVFDSQLAREQVVKWSYQIKQQWKRPLSKVGQVQRQQSIGGSNSCSITATGDMHHLVIMMIMMVMRWRFAPQK